MRNKTKRVLASSFVVAAAALAPVTARAADQPVIQFDPTIKAFSSLLPYRASFTLDVPTPKNALSVGVWFWEAAAGAACSSRPPSAIHLSGMAQTTTADATEKHYQLSLPALHAGKAYCISIETVLPWSDAQSTLVATLVTDAVVDLAVHGTTIVQANFLSKITGALGPTAHAALLNQPGATVETALEAALGIGKTKIKPLVNLEKAGADYGSAQANLAAYLGVLQNLKSAIKIPGSPTDSAVTTAIAPVTLAIGPPPTTGPVAPPATLKNAINALAALLSKEDCAKVTEVKAKADCQAVHGVLSANTLVFSTGPQSADDLTSAVGGRPPVSWTPQLARVCARSDPWRNGSDVSLRTNLRRTR